MQKILYDICDDSKAKWVYHESNYACNVHKTKSHCVTYKFWKWQKKEIGVWIRARCSCFVNLSYKWTQITKSDQDISVIQFSHQILCAVQIWGDLPMRLLWCVIWIGHEKTIFSWQRIIWLEFNVIYQLASW